VDLRRGPAPSPRDRARASCRRPGADLALDKFLNAAGCDPSATICAQSRLTFGVPTFMTCPASAGFFMRGGYHRKGAGSHRSYLTYVAAIAQLAVGNYGQVTILRVDLAIDCGLAVNPNRVRAQLEDAAIKGIVARYSTISRSSRDGSSKATSVTI
jgi:CO/xanthine dehydrogenase Mo-binding subunit